MFKLLKIKFKLIKWLLSLLKFVKIGRKNKLTYKAVRVFIYKLPNFCDKYIYLHFSIKKKVKT